MRHLILNNGAATPAVGFGVFQTPPDAAERAVACALETGYRLLDTAAHGKTPAQIVIRRHLRQGRSAIPTSVRPQCIADTFDVSDFQLTPAELEALDHPDTGTRGGPEPGAVTLEAFGRDIPEA
ncbi:hypothetical protein [Streptomyces tremellae]|uniref:hypothetical protein n=1 Tax=Streptomyces tremellae TaxID=1124239 RepID=UPI0031E698E9